MEIDFEKCRVVINLSSLFDMGFFEPSVMRGAMMTVVIMAMMIVVIAPMIMKFGKDVKFDVFYTMVTKKFVTSLL